MPTTQLLRSLGIFIIEDFMLASECSSLCYEVRHSDKTEAGTLSESDRVERIDNHIRRTKYGEISKSSHASIHQRIRDLKPSLENFFNESLADELEQPKYLHYAKGDFFAPHTDEQFNRKINITINLNSRKGQSPDQGYEGGDLQLYGLIKQDGFNKRGIAAPSHSGCLIAYPVNIVHEVTPITSGERFSIVSRFLSKH